MKWKMWYLEITPSLPDCYDSHKDRKTLYIKEKSGVDGETLYIKEKYGVNQ